MPPRLNQKRARFVLSKIDEILAWERKKEAEKDTRFVELGRYLCEVRAGQYWRLENLKGFDDFLERRFPESRRKAYYLMSIHEHLPPEVRRDLKEIGWSKGLELAKLARSQNGKGFESATWLHRARTMAKEEFQREVEKELTGNDCEPHELIYFKVYKSQIPVIEQAIETAAMMLGSDKSRGYCLEMICADFLAGANLDNAEPKVLLRSLSHYYGFLPGEQQLAFMRMLSDGDVNSADLGRMYKSITNNFAVHSGEDSEANLITLCENCQSLAHGIAGHSSAGSSESRTAVSWYGSCPSALALAKHHVSLETR